VNDLRLTGTLRRASLLVLAVGAIGFGVVAWRFVPWHPVPWEVGALPKPSEVFSSDQVARAEAFSGTSRRLGFGSLAISLVVASALGFTRWGRHLMARLPGSWPVRVVLGTFVVLLCGRLATLPLALLVRDHVHDYGLSNQPLGAWFVDRATGLGLGVVTASVAVLVVIGSARRWPRVWPMVAAPALGTLVMLGSFVYPVLVEPLFNDFKSLAAGPLRSEVLALAEREGVHVDDVLVADASRRTTTLNAYVSGFGDTRRVVLYDNLVDDVQRAEVLSVVAHELGHAKYDDVLLGSALGAFGTMLGVGLLGLAAATTRRTRPGPEAVPLLLALVAWASLLAAPVENGISRQVETRADATALETANDPEAFVAVQKELAVRNLNDPTPPAVLQWWFGSHPETLRRIAMARSLP